MGQGDGQVLTAMEELMLRRDWRKGIVNQSHDSGLSKQSKDDRIQRFFNNVKSDDLYGVVEMLLGSESHELAAASNGDDNETALHISCMNGYHNMTQVLLDFGSSILAQRCSDKQTPIDLSFRYRVKFGIQDESGQGIRGLQILDRHDQVQAGTKLSSLKTDFYRSPTFRKFWPAHEKVDDLSDYLTVFQTKIK